MNINRVDFNLLKAFSALMSERNVTRAGEKIGLAQPSMSNALSRMRDLFNDELFIRTPQGMLPTTRAKELAPTVSSVIELVGDMVDPPAAFDPWTAEGSIRIATSDNLNLTLGVDLVERIKTLAPQVNLNFRPLNKRTAFDALDQGEVDFLIGTFGDIPARFFQKTLLKDKFLCIARESHPALKKGLSLRRFAEIPHVLMTLNEDRDGVVDQVLKKSKLNRRVALTVGSFLVIPDIVASTDYIATIPASLANKIAKRSGCLTYKPPLKLAEWNVTLVWSQSTNRIKLANFVKEQLYSLC